MDFDDFDWEDGAIFGGIAGFVEESLREEDRKDPSEISEDYDHDSDEAIDKVISLDRKLQMLYASNPDLARYTVRLAMESREQGVLATQARRLADAVEKASRVLDEEKKKGDYSGKNYNDWLNKWCDYKWASLDDKVYEKYPELHWIGEATDDWKITLDYLNLEGEWEQALTVQPKRLAKLKDKVFIYAFCDQWKKHWYFRMDRIRNMNLAPESKEKGGGVADEELGDDDKSDQDSEVNDPSKDKAEDSYHRKLCAEGCKKLGNDDREVKCCIMENENRADCSYYWIQCAKDWMINDDGDARSFIIFAENKAEDSSEWIACASTWIEIFNDNEEARRCIMKAENKAYDSYDWIKCAESWKGLFNDDKEARRCITEAEHHNNYRTTSAEALIQCAESWKGLFNDDKEARRCITEAEHQIDDYDDDNYPIQTSDKWTKCAESWKKLINDDHEVRRCIMEAERIVVGSNGWTKCAESWKKLINDDHEARRCIMEAEKKADNSFNWTACAEIWKKFFNDDHEARRCIMEAEKKADNSFDWRACAEIWKKFFNDDHEARRCMKEAENKADNSFDWIFCVEIWKKLINDDREARRCMQEAENKADNSSHWRTCAAIWKTYFNDDHEKKRCINEGWESERLKKERHPFDDII